MEAERRKLTCFANTAEKAPCLLNHDAIDGVSQYRICSASAQGLAAHFIDTAPIYNQHSPGVHPDISEPS